LTTIRFLPCRTEIPADPDHLAICAGSGWEVAAKSMAGDLCRARLAVGPSGWPLDFCRIGQKFLPILATVPFLSASAGRSRQRPWAGAGGGLVLIIFAVGCCARYSWPGCGRSSAKRVVMRAVGAGDPVPWRCGPRWCWGTFSGPCWLLGGDCTAWVGCVLGAFSLPVRCSGGEWAGAGGGLVLIIFAVGCGTRYSWAGHGRSSAKRVIMRAGGFGNPVPRRCASRWCWGRSPWRVGFSVVSA